jgi:hypothetical protein
MLSLRRAGPRRRIAEGSQLTPRGSGFRDKAPHSPARRQTPHVKQEETTVTPTSKALVGLTAALALSFAIGPTMAQGGGPIDPGPFTIENVHPWHPFDGPDVNVDEVDLAVLAAIAEEWDDEDLWMIRARCSAIVADPARAGAVMLMPGVPYGENAVPFCEAVFAWTAENRPDAPDTWEELQAVLAAAGD